MTDPADKIEPFTEEFAGGFVTLEYEPLPGGQMRIAAFASGDVLESGEYSTKIFGSATLKGQFLNSVEESLTDKSGVDAGEIRQELKEWFAEMNEVDEEEQEEKFLTDEIRQIIAGTQYPVEIHGGEETIWNVEITFAGRTSELQFTSAQMVSGGGAALQEKIANNFFEIIEVEKEDWEAIRDRWQQNSEVVSVVSETGEDAIAERVVSMLSRALTPVEERDDMKRDVANAWYDEGNSTLYPECKMDDDILWIQDDFLVDQLERAGKQTSYKGQLVKHLIRLGKLHGEGKRKKWTSKRREKVYPAVPAEFGIDADDVREAGESNNSEVGL